MKTLCFLILLIGGPGTLGAAPQRDPVSREAPAGLAKSDWQSIREAYEAGRHVFQPVEGGWEALNPGQQWTTKCDGRGFRTRARGADWEWGLELKGYGFPGAERVVGGVSEVKADGQRLSYDWDAAVQEWFVNDQRGLEHGFTVKERPDGTDGTDGTDETDGTPVPSPSHELSFTLCVRGTLTPHLTADALGIEFRDAAGATVLTYGGLKVWDADGKVLPSRFAPSDSQLSTPNSQPTVRLLVEERGARYPLTIDPIAQQAYLKAHQVSSTDQFGSSVAASGDTVVVGAPYEDGGATGVNGTVNEDVRDSGAAYVFVRSGTAWTQQAYLKASQVSARDYFGNSVAISGDTVVVGAYEEDGSSTGVNGPVNELAPYSGAAFVFVRRGTTWSQQAYLKASQISALDDSGNGDSFGTAVAISGDTVVVGSPGEDGSSAGVNGPVNEGAKDAGAAYVFVRDGAAWSQQAYLKANQISVGDFFASSVAVWGTTVVVGAANEDGSSPGVNGALNESAYAAGAAYVFAYNGTTWAQQAYLKASQVSEVDQFGSSVAVAGDTVVVGARWEDGSATGINGPANEGPPDAGAAYVFVRSGAAWSQQAYLKASQVSANDYFGTSVAISGDTVVIGSPGEDGSATGVNGMVNEETRDAGAAWVFTRSGTVWRQQAYLKNSPTRLDQNFGNAVAISGETAVVGAQRESGSSAGVNGPVNQIATYAGAAYIFSGVGNRGAGGSLKLPFVVLNGVDIGFAQRFANGPVEQAFVPIAWNASTGPWQAADENAGTVYENTAGTLSGLAFALTNPGVGFDQITFHKRADSTDSTPVSYSLWGRGTPSPDGLWNGNYVAYMLSSSSLLTSGTINLPGSAGGSDTVRVQNFAGFPSYILVFTDLRGPNKATMQIAEVSFERTAPHWGPIGHTGNLLFLRATGLQNQVYTLYRNTGWTPGGWLPIGETTGEAGGVVHFNTVGSSPRSFYLIEEKGVSLAR